MKSYIKFCLFLFSFILFFALTPPKSFAQTCTSPLNNFQGDCPADLWCKKVDDNCKPDRFGGGCDKKCEPKPNKDQADCDQKIGCGGDFICSKNNKCTAKPTSGGACTRGTTNIQGNCASGLVCVTQDACNPRVPRTCEGTCQSLKPDGQSCNENLKGGDCQSGNCDNDTCKPKPLPTGSKCDSIGEACCFVAHNLPKTCDGGLTCINDKCSADCGAKDQQCCRTRGETKGSCDKEPNLECSNNKCQIIGAEKDPPSPPLPPCAVEGQIPCKSFKTGLGSFATDPGKFVASVFAILLAASGAIALILIMRAGYKIMTSQGKPDTIQEGREQLIAAVVGLLFLIFSLVFLEVIGVDILQIPGAKGNVQEGGQCDAGSNSQCAPGLTCESVGGTKNGICTDKFSLPGITPNPINISECSQQQFQLGSNGNCVEAIQRMLNVEPVDGVFGPITEDAVRKYQTDNGLIIDGTFNTCTWNAIMGDEIPNDCKR